MRIDSIFPRRLFFSLLLPLFCFMLASLYQVRPLHAKNAAITDFTVSNAKEELLLYLTVIDCFTPEMEAAIHNGIPATFTFYVDLFQKRTKWPDKKVKEHEFNHIMEYDSLKKEYLIQRQGKGDHKVTASLEEAKRFMSEINGFKVIPLDELEPETSYKIRVKAKLARKTLPLYFHNLIPFSSLWDFETKWHELTLHLVL